MTADAADPVGLYFGTTSGELWMSRDEGRRWACIARHLPEIYAVEAARACESATRDEGADPSRCARTPSSSEVEASGATLAAVLADLDRRYPGIRFRMIDEQDRMRRHMRFFVNGEQVCDLCAAAAPDRRGADRPGAERRLMTFVYRMTPHPCPMNLPARSAAYGAPLP